MDNETRKVSPLGAITGALTLAAFLLLLCSSDVAIEYMKKGLILCSGTVIPSLFPFMVISELIVSSGIGVSLSRILARPMRIIFGVNETGATAFLLGTVCGFPIGAATAASMHDKGIITKEELEHFLIFCNNPGSAFVISAVGASLFGNKNVGVLLYASVILSSVAVGAVGRLFLPKHKKVRLTITPSFRQKPITSRITDAIRSSALSMLTVCAYVLFFSALVGCIGALLERFSLPRCVRALIFGFFELSSGVNAASGENEAMMAMTLCALFLGWSGLSVHLQVMSVCSGRGISFKPYLIAKAAQGLICATITLLSLRLLFPTLGVGSIGAFSQGNTPLSEMLYALSVAFFVASVIFLIGEKLCSTKNKK